MKERQTKDERQLAKLEGALDFISNKFDEYEQHREDKKERIKHFGRLLN